MSNKIRADIAMIEQGLVQSREKAQSHIMAGLVYLKEMRIDKPSQQITQGEMLTLRGAVHPYVSRGGLKLAKALQVFDGDVKDKIIMDIGAATGGFTDVLLRSGAGHVYAIDVGYGQLDWSLRQDSRVTVMERTNARHLEKSDFINTIGLPTVTVMDVSFISIKLIIPTAISIMGDDGCFYSLIKPQFEAGKEKVGKKGVVRDPETHFEVIAQIEQFVNDLGWVMSGLDYSPITGPEGNIEFISKIIKQRSGTARLTENQIKLIIAGAHEKHKK